MTDHLYEGSLVVTFVGEDIEHADEIIDDLIEELESKAFQVEAAVVEESVEIRDE